MIMKKKESLNDLVIWSVCCVLMTSCQTLAFTVYQKSLNSCCIAIVEKRRKFLHRICAIERKCFEGKSREKKVANHFAIGEFLIELEFVCCIRFHSPKLTVSIGKFKRNPTLFAQIKSLYKRSLFY